jgi:hypothetical protein
MRAIRLLLLAVLLPAPVAAQTKIVVGAVLPSADSPVSLAEDLVIDIDTPRLVRRLPVIGNGFVPQPPMRATPDGTFAVNSYFRGVGRLTLSAIGVDRLATGERWLFEGIYAGHLIADPRRTAMYFSNGGKVGVLDPSGIRWWQVCAPLYAIDSVVSALAVAPDGNALYVACGTTFVVLNPETGAENSRWQLAGQPRSMHAISGHRLLVLDWGEGRRPHLTLYDLNMGTMIRSVAFDGATWVVPSPAGDRVLVGHWRGPLLTDAESFALLAELPADGVIEAAFTRDERRVVLLRQAAAALHVAVVDVETNALVADVPLGFHHSVNIHGLALIEPPLAPVDVFAQVLGRTVSLVWSLPRHSTTATDYLIEVGATPGAFLAFASRSASLGTTLQVSNVPPGTYYVRIRGVNAAGVSGPSSVAHVAVQ